MFPVLIAFKFPDWLGSISWIELTVSLALLLGLFVWRYRKENFSYRHFVFWVGAYVIVRGLCVYAGPGYQFELHNYGVLIAIGFAVGIYLASRQARREGIPAYIILDLAFWIIIAAMVGSRVLFIIVNMDDYIAQPINLLKIWQGGLVFYGGLIGAALATWIYTQQHNLNFLQIADVIMPSLAIGHVFGRLGCFAAGCCHGMPTGIEGFGVVFSDPGTVVARNHLLGVPVHPTQLYDAGGELLIFLVLIFLRRRKRFDGQLFIAYLIMYPILRSVVEMFRGDYERGMLLSIDLFGSSQPDILSTSQLISLLIAVGALFLLSFLLRQRKRQTTVAASPAPPGPPQIEEPADHQPIVKNS
jgi:phosphatidylglycerol:prolipoprotein diacylglycerol transferase